MTTVIRKEASGRPDLTAEVFDAVARGAQTYPLQLGDEFVTGAPGVGVWTLMLQSCLRRGRQESLERAHLRDGDFVVIDKERDVMPIANDPGRERRLLDATRELLNQALSVPASRLPGWSA
jgi:hypothetical protein